ncbi:MAG: hypothetical protein IPM96_20335 [Ignavibacteria bacterium]|nr:hypothetical protein [Ignavibacteria bacterium]
MKYKKIILLILDGCGIGEQDDYLKFQNIQTNTVGNIYKKNPKFRLPFLESMGLGQLLNLPSETSNHIYSWYGKMKQQTLGNDTFAGVWEMLGIIFYTRFVSNMQSLDATLINKIKEECETSVICNLYISGYIALDKYFQEHQRTKLPIFTFQTTE